MNNYLTKKALEKLKKRLKTLKEKRKEIAKRLQRVTSFGDITDNAAFDEAKEAQAFLEGEILELEKTIREAKIIEPGLKKGEVIIGSKLVLETGGKEKEFLLTSSVEAEPQKGKISAESPLGKALLGKKKGAKVSIKTPQGKIEYKILKIE